MKQGWMLSLMQWLEKKEGLSDQRPDAELPDEPFGPDNRQNCQRIVRALNNPVDLIVEPLGGDPDGPWVLYFKSLVDPKSIQRDILRPLQMMRMQKGNSPGLFNLVSIGEKKTVDQLKDALLQLLQGWTLVSQPKGRGFCAFNTESVQGRTIEKAENQSIVVGPQEAFSETLDLNLSLIRKRLRSPLLLTESMLIGKVTKTKMCILTLKGITNEQYLKQIKERIEQVDVDGMLDSGVLAQWIDDQPWSPFPQFDYVERPDAIVAGLLSGKIIIALDGTPYMLMGPSVFIEFFQSPEDYFNRWASTSLLRILRIIGVSLSITLSAIYVAILTYHYEIIPATMLKTIAQSRSKVPFPPVYEAMLLELILELLREAGARLPTKVGQTMGIVGGIVIGQAAVSAGLTSNVMIIVVSLSALSSFITPSYVMSNAVRVIRFPMILLAGLWGFIGMFVGLIMTIIHLLNLSSLGAPYMSPFAPLRLADLKDTLWRVPMQLLGYRPSFTKTKKDKTADMMTLKRK